MSEHPRDLIFLEVESERHRQDAKWGEQNHDDAVWQLILDEEVGEVAKASLERMFGHDPGVDPHGTPSDAIRAELIQVAAVAVSWIEALDRRAA